MGKILKTLVIMPLALLLLAFAVANRQLVMVSFDPFDSSDSSLALTLPLFIVIIAAAILGVIAGGIATWFGQRRWRRAARRHEAEARDARQKLAEWNAHVPLAPSGHDRLAPVAQAPAGSYPGAPLAIGQDKGGAAL
ncbi:MAG: LapA family protein [Xanthobacteraceae bacterium]|nr:LapA family protein [Xanthobacteraceae bacterium]